MTTAKQDLEQWQPLVACLEFTVRNARKAWTVQTESKDWDFGPYVQAQYVDGEIIAEITGNKFLQPGVPIHDEHRLQFLGWQKPYGYDFPNWYKVVQHNVQGHEEIAKLWVKTLVEIFGMTPAWRFEVAPLSIDFIRAWRWSMCETRVVGMYRLVDRFGKTRDEQRANAAAQLAKEKNWDELAREVRFLFNRARKLGLSGTDLIRLAICEFSAEVQKVATELVYTGETEIGMRISADDVEALGLFCEVEFDEFAGLEFLETQADFDFDYRFDPGPSGLIQILRSVS